MPESVYIRDVDALAHNCALVVCCIRIPRQALHSAKGCFDVVGIKHASGFERTLIERSTEHIAIVGIDAVAPLTLHILYPIASDSASGFTLHHQRSHPSYLRDWNGRRYPTFVNVPALRATLEFSSVGIGWFVIGIKDGNDQQCNGPEWQSWS